ncbi:MerR family DNA-binding transcriptional regulator [Amycolatopsis tucumanensis]|uniref:MerR family DNA-binding transcriptional regulator n=1 Tax=Amycolatopsis tucumanensis TaxID=401106 RepID=UPI001F0321C9|nr:MerR family DNA-binding transcriptional regulator [Amycolatopsis tucumanensis]MCF6423355.1 MerR family DNA-binding transcriptional regulator [Amycolatopsis tucumanensis]
MAQDRLVSTGEAAKAPSVDRSTLDRWAREGLVTPAAKTAGGHNRWDVEDLKRQVRELQKRG